MTNIHQFHTSVDMSNEIKNAYESNVKFVDHDFSNILVDIVSFLPFLSGMIDVFIFNKLGIYVVTWFVIMVFAGAVLCVIDWYNLYKIDYNVDSLIFWAIFLQPVYLYLRAKTVNSGQYLIWFWLVLFLVVCIFAPM